MNTVKLSEMQFHLMESIASAAKKFGRGENPNAYAWVSRSIVQASVDWRVMKSGRHMSGAISSLKKRGLIDTDGVNLRLTVGK